MGKALGIDLGTTFSAMAVLNENGEAEILANREGERITPSVVLFEEDGPVIGTLAKQNAADDALSVCQFVKRKMGERTTAFRSADGQKFSPEEISALILKRLKEDAEELFGEQIDKAVITVPAYFNDAQRKATEDAGAIAGLNVAAVINEPTAAALAYGVGKSVEGETALVYDLGGGTFDVTLLKVSSGLIEVLATNGDRNLGGFDWDNEVISLISQKAFGENAAKALADPNLAQVLRDSAELAKKTLTNRKSATVRFSHDGEKHKLEVSLDEFNQATRSLVKRTERLISATLEDAELSWNNIDKTLLVGGSSRMPAIAESVVKLTGKMPSRELHPDEVVALGAAYYCAQLEENPESKEVILVKDVCSHSLGIITVGADERTEVNSIVLKKDSPVPCEAQDVFSTVTDNQTRLNVRVTQGEDQDIKYVHVLGESTMTLPPYPKGAPLQVTFKYDENAIVHVHVFDVTGGKSLGDMKIERTSNLTSEQVTALAARVEDISVN